MSIRVAVVDDQALVRGGFAMVLRIHDDIEVVAEADYIISISACQRHHLWSHIGKTASGRDAL